jgi:hypothetical protein
MSAARQRVSPKRRNGAPPEAIDSRLAHAEPHDGVATLDRVADNELRYLYACELDSAERFFEIRSVETLVPWLDRLMQSD